MMHLLLCWALLGAAAGSGAYTTTTLTLPAAPAQGIWMDYLLYDHATHTVWVPAGGSGAVDVIDTATGKLTQIGGFPTGEMERNGHKQLVGPSSIAAGSHVVYVGSRGDFTVCAVDSAKLTRGACGKLDSMPDALAYVAATQEVWVTTPRDKSVRILDDKTLAQKARLAFAGDPETLAVDASRHRVYTNLEDADLTLAVDLATHTTVATWKPGCGEGGPHGLALDEAKGFLFVACGARTKVLDVDHAGAVLASIETGDGVDALEYTAATHRLYIGAAKAGKLTVAEVGAKGTLTTVAVVPVAEGSRNGVVDDAGKVYLAHSAGSDVVVVSPPAGLPERSR